MAEALNLEPQLQVFLEKANLMNSQDDHSSVPVEQKRTSYAKAFKYVAPQMTLSGKYLQLQPMYLLSVYSVIHSGHSALQAETAIVKQPLLHDTMATLD